jgi:hypothetical protein
MSLSCLDGHRNTQLSCSRRGEVFCRPEVAASVNAGVYSDSNSQLQVNGIEQPGASRHVHAAEQCCSYRLTLSFSHGCPFTCTSR